MAFHSRLTAEQSDSLERVQKVSLKVILGDNFIGYSEALEMTGLSTLFQRREDRCLSFSLKCLKHPIHKKLFPLNSVLHEDENEEYLRDRELFKVNHAHTETYRQSTIGANVVRAHEGFPCGGRRSGH